MEKGDNSNNTYESILSRIDALPSGSIVTKKISGHDYYYLQWREGNKVKSKYLKRDEIETVREEIEERHELEIELKRLDEKSLIKRLFSYSQFSRMKQHVSIGHQDFERIITHNLFYIDKTEFIKDFWSCDDSVTLITRPRRFGKTLTLSMLECFFSTKYRDRSDLFKGLSVWKHPELRKLQGTYPVISISFAGMYCKTYNDFLAVFKTTLFNLCSSFNYLDTSELLSEEDCNLFHSLYDSVASFNSTANAATLAQSLQLLSALLYKHHGKKVIILIDEYDTPIIEAFLNGIYDEVISFFRCFFSFTLKSNPYLERALVTGITRVSKESLFSGLNNLTIASMTSELYESAFGFTEREAFTALEAQGMGDEETKKCVKEWYDGFTIGNATNIYNPWSIINFLREKKFKPYWANTGSSDLISALIKKGSVSNIDKIHELIEGRSIDEVVDESLTFNELYDTPSAVFTLMYVSGYITLNNEMYKATNKECILEFKHMLKRWFTAGVSGYNSFITALLSCDLARMNDYMNVIMRTVLSYFDTSSEAGTYENFYHGFMLGLLVELEGDYIVRSNRESGYGRYDIMLIPRNVSDNAYILEFKTHDKANESTLSDTVSAALSQINDKSYDTELIDMGIQEKRIHKYGFAFKGKTVLIGD